MPVFATMAIGGAIGFLGGLFGKGGSAVATPLLRAAGVPAIVALAAPLPATIPATIVAAVPYRRAGLVDARVVRWSVAFGVPATIIGALATRWIGGSALVSVTDVLVAAIGFRFVLRPRSRAAVVADTDSSRYALAAVAITVGLFSGLLANSGGLLLAPLYIAILRLPLKRAFACSLVVAAVLAVPGTAVHWLLGHIDWAVVGVFGSTSVPMSAVGARLAVRADGRHLERAYGAVLLVISVALLGRG